MSAATRPYSRSPATERIESIPYGAWQRDPDHNPDSVLAEERPVNSLSSDDADKFAPQKQCGDTHMWRYAYQSPLSRLTGRSTTNHLGALYCG